MGVVVKKSFDFVDAGRTFACRIEEARRPNTTAWWWFTVSSDNHRYAPFHFDATDTEDSVRARIVGFYDNRLARRDAPRQPWRRPEKAATPVVPANPDDPARPAGESPPPPASNNGQSGD
jgi:hypothetical protein